MFGFFKRREKVAQPESEPSAKGLTSELRQQASNTQEEMIRFAWKDTLRFHGVPADWVSCDVQRVLRKDGVSEFLIYLVVRKWNDQLPRYCFALQKKLLTRLDWYEPKVDHSDMMVAWRYDKHCACPHTEMPSEEYWIARGEGTAAQRPAEVLDRRRRPRANGHSVYIHDSEQAGLTDVAYAPTALAPLTDLAAKRGGRVRK